MNFFLFGLVGLGGALELIQAFGEQTCTRGTVFSLQIDDHFDGTIINATVISPDFLSISKRTVSVKKITSLNPDFNMNYTAITFFSDKIMILEDSGIIIYKGIYSYRELSLIDPELVQYYRDPGLGKYTGITGGLTFAVYNKSSVLFFVLKDKIYPTQIAALHSFTGILKVAVEDDRIFVVESKSIKVFTVIDYELGWSIELQEVVLDTFGIGNPVIVDCYLGDRTFYLLDARLGVLVFENFIEYKRLLNYPGYKLAGFEHFLFIDGKTEINLVTLTVKSYAFNKNCVYLAISSNFVFCAGTKSLTTTSRVLNMTDEKYIGIIHDVQTYKGFLFIALMNQVTVYLAELGPIYIEGKVPDKVSEHKVVFNVSSESQILTEFFMLNIQYSLTNVIIFILLSFITVFGMVFICSFICKCLTQETEKPPEVTANEGQVLPSTDRNLASDRELIARLR